MDDAALDSTSLDMQPHPEGGWFRETWRHESTIDTPNGQRALVTCVAFLLEAGQRSAWHRGGQYLVRPDEWQAAELRLADSGGANTAGGRE